MNPLVELAKLDSAMQRGLDNAFAFVFGGKVVREEIEELLKQQVQDNLSATDDERVLAPNVFNLGVSSKDLENLSQDRHLAASLGEQLSRFIRNHNWSIEAPVVVRIGEESGLRTGQLRVSSYFVANPEMDSGFDAIEYIDVPEEDAMPEANEQKQPQEPESQAAVTLLLQDGSSRTFHVQEGSNIIGRSNDADFRLPDTGVSREHAEVTWDGRDAVLVDLESTNGTTVNDTPIDNWLLGDGDVITIGHSQIEVRITEPSA